MKVFSDQEVKTSLYSITPAVDYESHPFSLLSIIFLGLVDGNHKASVRRWEAVRSDYENIPDSRTRSLYKVQKKITIFLHTQALY